MQRQAGTKCMQGSGMKERIPDETERNKTKQIDEKKLREKGERKENGK